MTRLRRPVWIPEDAPAIFPDPRLFDAEGLVAGGGDLSIERLIAAYRSGIFPWFNEPPILWWSPDPRALLDPEHLHVSRSLLRTLRKCGWSVRATSELGPVMVGCAEREEGTWITDEMFDAYVELGRRGHALAYEVRDGDELVGGLYGVLTGGLFAAESKFHRARDASKVALVVSVLHTFARGAQLFDVQFKTDHLATLGVREVTRDEYLARLERALVVAGASEGAVASTSAGSPPGEDVDLLPWSLEKWAERSAHGDS